MKIGVQLAENQPQKQAQERPRVHDNKMEAKWTIY